MLKIGDRVHTVAGSPGVRPEDLNRTGTIVESYLPQFGSYFPYWKICLMDDKRMVSVSEYNLEKIESENDTVKEGLRRERSNPDWPFPYAPNLEHDLPAVWRGRELTNIEWNIIALSTPFDMAVWNGRYGLSWDQVRIYWEKRWEQDGKILMSKPDFGWVKEGLKLPHLCGYTNCPDEELHNTPHFAVAPAMGHPDVVKSAGKQPYNSLAGDNMVSVEFVDGAKAWFPGRWLRQQAEQGESRVRAMYAKQKAEGKSFDLKP